MCGARTGAADAQAADEPAGSKQMAATAAVPDECSAITPDGPGHTGWHSEAGGSGGGDGGRGGGSGGGGGEGGGGLGGGGGGGGLGGGGGSGLGGGSGGGGGPGGGGGQITLLGTPGHAAYATSTTGSRPVAYIPGVRWNAGFALEWQTALAPALSSGQFTVRFVLNAPPNGTSGGCGMKLYPLVTNSSPSVASGATCPGSRSAASPGSPARYPGPLKRPAA